MTLRRWFLLFATFALVAFTASASSASVTETGVHGLVLRGPTKPACPAETPCTAPAVGVLVKFVSGAVVHQVRTNAHGRYAIQLAPGTYAVRIDARFGYKPLTAKVVRLQMSTVNVLINTGIY